MNKVLTLLKYFNFVQVCKILIAVFARRLGKSMDSYPTEFYKVYNHVQRAAGLITRTGKEVEISLTEGQQPVRLRLRTASSDFSVFYNVFSAKEYQPLVTLIKSFPQATVSSIIDAGSNVGFTAVYLAAHFKNASIIAIEPDKGNFAMLQKNMALNGLQQAVLLNMALWGSDDKIQLDHSFRDHREWSIRVKKADGSAPQVTLDGISLPTLLKDSGWPTVDILKIDIEGAEKEVFAEQRKSVEVLKKVRFLVIELHDEVDFKSQFETLLREAGFIYTYANESLLAVNIKLMNP